MPAQRFLQLVSGRLKEAVAVIVSAGAASDGAIPALDATGKLDASVMPSGFGQNTKSVQASEALSANDLVNFHNAGGPRMRKADATVEGKEAHGFVNAAVANGAVGVAYLPGNTIAGLSGLTPGARQFLHTTAGARVETAPSASGNVVQVIGIAVSATEISFEPEEPVTLA